MSNETSDNIKLPDALKAAGFKPQEISGLPEGVTAFVGNSPDAAPKPSDPWEGFEVIDTYSRAQAIADGVLVDLMQGETGTLVREAGFKYPIAMTVGAFSEAVAPIGEDLPPGQSITGRLRDVLQVLKAAILKSPPGNRVDFPVLVDKDGQGHHKTVKLYSLCGPGDDAEPVITIMLPWED